MEIKTIIESINKCKLNQHDEHASFFSKIYADSEEERIKSLNELKKVLVFGKFYLDYEAEITDPEVIDYTKVKATVQTYIINILRYSDRVPAISGFWVSLGLELINEQISMSSWKLFENFFSEEASSLLADLYFTSRILDRLKDYEKILSCFPEYLKILKKVKLYNNENLGYASQLDWILDHLLKSGEDGLSESNKKTIIELMNLLTDLVREDKIGEYSFDSLLADNEYRKEFSYYAGIIPWIKYFKEKWNTQNFSDMVCALLSGDGHDLWECGIEENESVTMFLEQWFFMAEYYSNMLLMSSAVFLKLIYAFYNNKIVDPKQITFLDRSINKEGDVEKLLTDVPGLFVKYEDPIWFRKYFFELTDLERACFFTLAQGRSLHYMEGLPLKISKKESHTLANLPEEFIPIRYCPSWLFLGVLYARLIIHGATCGLIIELKRHFDDVSLILRSEDNINELSGFLLRNEENFLQSQNKSQTLEYISHRLNNEEYFSLNGRSYNRLEAEAIPWHANYYNPVIKSYWDPVSIRNFVKYVDNKLYVIQQIKELRVLKEEGEQMNHCVGTYALECVSGRSAIFSLKEISRNRVGRLLTLEIQGKQIVQVKGKDNRNMSSKERSIIKMWAEKERLGMAV